MVELKIYIDGGIMICPNSVDIVNFELKMALMTLKVHILG